MKQCPICQKKFPDSEEFCPVHGVQLEGFKDSTTKAWIAAGLGILSYCALWGNWWNWANLLSLMRLLLGLALSVTAVILPRGSRAAFPKWCAYVTGYLMILKAIWLIIDCGYHLFFYWI